MNDEQDKLLEDIKLAVKSGVLSRKDLAKQFGFSHALRVKHCYE